MTLLSIYYDVHKSNSRLRDLKDVQVIMAESSQKNFGLLYLQIYDQEGKINSSDNIINCNFIVIHKYHYRTHVINMISYVNKNIK